MRLSPQEVSQIKRIFSKFSKGSDVQIFLFGSRADDTKKGGDIDLLLVFENKDNLAKFSRLDFLVELKKELGERRIDLTLAPKDDLKTDLFLSSIYKDAIELK